jgi:hypothetical protein
MYVDASRNPRRKSTRERPNLRDRSVRSQVWMEPILASVRCSLGANDTKYRLYVSRIEQF